MQKKESFKQNQRSICKNCGDGIIFQSDCWVHPQFINCNGGCLHPEPLDHKSATHYLSCRHSYNRWSDCYYKMLCLILKELPNNRVKILVFGDRRKKIEYCEGKQSIRYVSKDRLSVIPQTLPKGDFSNEKEHNISYTR